MNCRTLYPCFSILIALVASADEPQSDSTLLPVSVVKPVEFVDGTFAGNVTAEEIGRMQRLVTDNLAAGAETRRRPFARLRDEGWGNRGDPDLDGLSGRYSGGRGA